jgi:hypothetical protein
LRDWQIVARYMQLDRRANCSSSIDDLIRYGGAGGKLEANWRELP